MRTQRWQVTLHACPQPNGIARLSQVVQLVIDHEDARIDLQATVRMAARVDDPESRRIDDKEEDK